MRNEFIGTRIISSFRQRGVAFSLLAAISAFQAAYRNYAYARMLGIRNLSIGANPRIIGSKYISIGSKFIALNNFWLAAIDSHSGQTYNPQVTIGNNVVVGDSVHIAAVRRVSIGDNVLMGSRILITDHNHGIYRGTFQTDPNVPPQLRTLGEEGVVSIGRNVWLGDGVVVLPNTIIGDGSLVGANSVVSGEIPKHSIAVGAPAKVIRTFDTLTNHWICYSK